MFNFLEFITLDPVVDWIKHLVMHNGAYMSILLLLLEESGVPLPVPGDVILAYAGYQISKGSLSYAAIFITALLAVLIGSSILYYLSSQYGKTIVLRLGKYIHVDEHKISVVEEKFKKYGPLVIIFGRHIPGFRIPITIFAGISKISYPTFIVCTTISVIFWIPLYLSLGKSMGPRTMHLFHAHPWYFLLALAPFTFLIASIIYSYRKKPKKST